MTTVEDELKRLNCDIEGLLEFNRLDWLALAEKPMSREERLTLRKAIAARSIDLSDLMERKWAIIKGRQ